MRRVAFALNTSALHTPAWGAHSGCRRRAHPESVQLERDTQEVGRRGPISTMYHVSPMQRDWPCFASNLPCKVSIDSSTSTSHANAEPKAEKQRQACLWWLYRAPINMPGSCLHVDAHEGFSSDPDYMHPSFACLPFTTHTIQPNVCTSHSCQALYLAPCLP